MTVTGEAHPGEGVEEQEGLQHAVQMDPIPWVPRFRQYSGTLGSANTLHKAARVEKQSSSAQQRNQAEPLASTCCRWVILAIKFEGDNPSSSLRF